MTRNHVGWTFGFCLFLLTGCNSGHQDTTPDALRVTVSKPLKDKLPSFQYFTGYTKSEKLENVKAQVSGYLDKILYKEGDIVKVGTKLFLIDPRLYKAQVEAAQADVERTKAKAQADTYELARQEQLFRQKAASKADYDVAVGNASVSNAQIKAAEAKLAQAKLDFDFTTVVSHTDGRAGIFDITEGNLVVANQTLLTTINSIDPMYVDFSVDEHTLLGIKQLIRQGKFKSARDGAKVPVEIRLANETHYGHAGFINFVDSKLDQGTGTLPVRAEIPNKDEYLTAGLFCRIRVTLGEPVEKMLVPERAILTMQGQKFVFIVDPKNVVQTRPIVVGALNDGLRVVEEGLKGDERVIINGIQLVRAGVSVDPVAGEIVPLKGEDAAAPAKGKS